MSLSVVKNGQPASVIHLLESYEGVGKLVKSSATTPWSLLKDDREASIVLDCGRAKVGIPFYEAVAVDVVYSETYEGIDKGDAIKDYYMHSGDIAILQHVFDRLDRLIEFTQRFIGDRGLVVAPPPLSTDWFPMGGPLFGSTGKINVAYHGALQSMSMLSAVIGIDGRYSNRSKALKEGIVTHLWNGETGTMRMSDTTSLTGICQDINAQAIIAALPLAYRLSLPVTKDNAPLISPYVPTNPNYSGGHLEAMKSDDTPITENTSLMHGWSTWLVHLLPRYLGGVEPPEAGRSRFMVKPMLAGVSSVDVQVATPAGEIKVSLRMREGDGEVSVNVPMGAVAKFLTPEI